MHIGLYWGKFVTKKVTHYVGQFDLDTVSYISVCILFLAAIAALYVLILVRLSVHNEFQRVDRKLMLGLRPVIVLYRRYTNKYFVYFKYQVPQSNLAV